VNCARTGLWGGRMGNHRLYPAADRPQGRRVGVRCVVGGGGGSPPALGTKHTTTKSQGKTHTMLHVVLRRTVSPRTSPGPRNTVPQDTDRAQEHSRYLGALSVLRRIVGVQAHRRCPYTKHWRPARRTMLYSAEQSSGARQHDQLPLPRALPLTIGSRGDLSAVVFHSC